MLAVLQWGPSISPDTDLTLQHLTQLAILLPSLTSLQILNRFALPRPPSDLAGLRLLRDLRRLSLTGCHVRDTEAANALVQQLGFMTELREVQLDVSVIAQDSPVEVSPLGGLHKLLSLRLWCGPVWLDGLQRVAAGCTRLQHLVLGSHIESRPNAAAGLASCTWPELRTLSLLGHNAAHVAAVLQALGPVHMTMPSLRSMGKLGLSASASRLDALQQLCQQLAASPRHRPDISIAVEDATSPTAVLQVMGPMAENLVAWRCFVWPASCEDVSALAAAAPRLEHFWFKATGDPAVQVAEHAVRQLPRLARLVTPLDPSIPEGYTALLSLCAVAESQILAASRQEPLTIYIQGRKEWKEALARLQAEWAGVSQVPQRVFIQLPVPLSLN